MSTTAQNSLWGNIPQEVDLETPYDVLLEQGKILEEVTRRRLVGIVTTRTSSEGLLAHHFYIQAPLLDGYSYPLLSVNHGASPFPLKVVWQGKVIPVKNMVAYKNLLGTVLGSNSTKEVIRSLIAQSNAVTHQK